MEKKSIEFIDIKLDELHTQGFDRLQLPGGTSLDGTFAVLGVLTRWEMNDLWILLNPYDSGFHRKNHSSHNKRAGESKEDAFKREILEETGYQVLPENSTLIYEKEVPDNRSGKLGAVHTKYFYLVTEFTGTAFTFEGPNPIDGETAAPIWIPASLAVKLIFGGHSKALQNAFEYLCGIDKKYAIALMNLM